MLEKIQKYQTNALIKQLLDVRMLGLLVFLVLVVLVSWSGMSAIQTNYGLQRQIAKLEQENTLRKLENDNQKLSNQYYTTDNFLELAARRQFGKAAPGEKLLLVPKKVALAHAVAAPEPPKVAPQALIAKSSYQQNFESWMSFFLHRQSKHEQKSP
jgi:cell division protein FtsB